MAQKNLTGFSKIMKSLSHSILFAGIGMVLLSLALTYYHFNPNRLSFRDTQYEKKKELAVHLKTPKAITIQDINVQLPIIPASIKDGIWETTDKGVSYLVQSPVPGSYGNSILYGHNWTKLLGKLVYIKPGQSFEIEFSDGSIEKFTIQTTAYVLPTDIAVLRQSKDSLVTLYTCAGPFDSKRFVVTARPS